MQNIITIIVFYFLFINCENSPRSQNKIHIQNQVFRYEKNQLQDTLVKFKKNIDSLGLSKELAEKYFNVFPNNFRDFIKLFGYNHKNPGINLYNEYSSFLITFEDTESYIDKKSYIKKLLKLCVNGKWEADATSMLQEITLGFIDKSPDLFLKEYSKFNNNERNSFWYFLIDGTENNKADYFKYFKIFNNKEIRALINKNVNIIKENEKREHQQN